MTKFSDCSIPGNLGDLCLTDKQRRFADAYALSGNCSDAARRAGYSARTARQQGSRLLSNVAVSEAIAARQAEYAAELEVTRQSVIAEIQDAIRMGREQQRPDVLIKAAMALAKLCGLLEPVRHKVEVGADVAALSAKFVSMTDAELLAVASGAR